MEWAVSEPHFDLYKPTKIYFHVNLFMDLYYKSFKKGVQQNHHLIEYVFLILFNLWKLEKARSLFVKINCGHLR